MTSPQPGPSRKIGSQPMTDNSYNQAIIGQYIQPNALNGVLISLSLIFILIIGFLLIMAVQTPLVLVNESLDWGKVEK